MEIQPVHSEGDQPWDFFGRNDAKAETPVLWPPHAKSWLIGKDSDARRDWGQEEKGTTEDEMAGWHHWLDGRESEWTPGAGDGQRGLTCCASWGRKESDATELNWYRNYGTERGLKMLLNPFLSSSWDHANRSSFKEFLYHWFLKPSKKLILVFHHNLFQGSMACFVRKSFLTTKLNPSYLSYHVLISVSLECVRYWNLK